MRKTGTRQSCLGLDGSLAATRLLIFEPSFTRIEASLAAHAPGLAPLVVDPSGAITLAGAPLSAEEARPDIAWASGELYLSPAAHDFMIAMLKSPGLRWVQSAAAGYDHPMFADIVRKGAKLTTSHGQAVGMADYVLAGVLDHFQRWPERRAAQADRTWTRLHFREILGTNWLIVGFGSIGQEVARRARAFGARIVGVRRDPSAHPLADEIRSLADLHEVLPTVDVVVLCLPAGKTTRHLADARFFGAMKTGSVFVNVGRGSLVDEQALLTALDNGTPALAVLDVFETEPLPETSLLWTHPRVVVTAHASGESGGQQRRNQTLFLDNLERFLAGAPLLNEANPEDVLDRR
jgi:phosphoglycerate dehydrogenase-like enzyme